IALLPLLAHLPAGAGADGHGGHVTWIDSLPIWSRGLAVLNAVGLSPALGTFVAGVMLASSEFRHELESNIEPFKSLLLAIFFISVGAGINFALIAEKPLTIGAMLLGLIVIKAVVLYALARWFNMSFDQRLLFTAALAQGGEFAFVLGGFAVAQGVIGVELASQMIAVVALSMVLAPPLLIFVQMFILPHFGTSEAAEERPHDVENDNADILLVGFGRFGHPMGRLLRSAGYDITVLEKDSDHVDFLRRIGVKCYYGDASRLQLLQAAGAEDAEVLILAIDDEEECMSIIETCHKHFAQLKIFARACSREHACRLYKAGVRFFGEQLASSLDCAIAVLEEMGHESEHAKDAARRFKEFEVKAIERIADHIADEQRFLGIAQQSVRDLDSLLVNAPLPIGGVQGKKKS
ncbi:MAG: NAD-binding protein, partial [Chthoniobacterales bacterium]